MRPLLIVITALVAAWPGTLAAQTRTTDSLAILRLIQQHEEAMRSFQADQQASLYTVDAVWINAFGRRRAGRDSIAAFLRGLYATRDTVHRAFTAPLLLK